MLEATALDFSRYGDTLFEVLFAGGRLAAGGNVVEEGRKLDTNVTSTPSPYLRMKLPPDPSMCLMLCVDDIAAFGWGNNAMCSVLN